jgi:hypothetical protein
VAVGGEPLHEGLGERVEVVRVALVAEVPDREDLASLAAWIMGSRREKSYSPTRSTIGQGAPSRQTAMPRLRRRL